MSENVEPRMHGDSEDRDPIARVLKAAGARPQPDAETTASFKQALHAEWRRATPRPRHARVLWWAAAAGIVMVLIGGWLRPFGLGGDRVATYVVGQIVRTDGVVRHSSISNASVSQNLIEGAQVHTNSVLETAGDGRVALAFGAGTSVRLDRDTRVVIIAGRSLKLERGAIYVDANSPKEGPLSIQTVVGEVRDIGTQFQLRLVDGALRVLVREGEVLVNANRSQLTARAGEALSLSSSGATQRTAILPYGLEWEWASQVAPRFELEGSTVQRFLDWVAREKGWRWRFVDDDTSRRASSIVTHGSIEGYTPEEALQVVLPTCGLAYVRNGDEIIVSFIKEATPRGR